MTSQDPEIDTQMRSRGSAIGLTLLLAVAALLTLVPGAGADVVIGGPGSGTGQMNNPRAVAVDSATGRLYVADTENDRIAVFNASSGAFVMAFGWGVADGISNEPQTCTSTCFDGLGGAGKGQLKQPTGVAVDNDPLSPSFHDLYVAESSNHRVQKFSPTGQFRLMVGGQVNKTTGENLCTASSGNNCGVGIEGNAAGQFNEFESVTVGPGGVLYVGDVNRVQKFEPSGVYGAQLLLPGDFGPTYALVVDSTGNFYVATPGATGAVRKYNPSGGLLATINPSFNINALTLDASDNLYVADNSSSASGIYKYDSGGTLQSVFYGTLERRVKDLALYHSALGDIFAAEEARFGTQGFGVVYVPFPPPGPVVLSSSVEASPIGSVKATLRARVNPEGKATTYHFQFVDQAGFEASGFSGASTKSTPESSSVGADFTLHDASATVTGLTPETVYHFRAVVSNADAPAGTPSIAGTFTTRVPLEVEDTWSTNVGVDGATLHVKANPLGTAASGYFEYVDAATHEVSDFANATQVPDVGEGASPIALGSGEVASAASAQAYPLSPSTTYYFRFVATNTFGTIFGPPRTLVTYPARAEGEDACPNRAVRTGPSAALPDCRAFEMVSPLDKNNGDIISPTNVTGYGVPFYQAATDGAKLSYSSFRAFGDAQGSPYVSQYVAARGDGGWATEGISPPMGPGRATTSALDNQFLAATDDLSSGWFLHDTDPPLAASAPVGFHNIYRFDAASGDYEPLNTVSPPHPTREFEPELRGVSSDGTKAVFVAKDNLTPNARTANITQTYESSVGGSLHLVSVLPDGTASKDDSSLGTLASGGATGTPSIRSSTLTHAISDDGSKVFWTAATTAGPGRIYLRENPDQEQSILASGVCTEPTKACTVDVSGAISTAAARFWTAAADGSVALFTISNNLYEYDVGSKDATLISGSVLGLFGASEDASRVYFVATGALVSGATAGRPNLYLYEKGVGFTFVTTLANVGDDSDYKNEPFRRTSRVSPDGGHIAFMSIKSLTGYDNIDTASGQPDTEVYTYQAGGEVACASCNPSGARPLGRAMSGGSSYRKRYSWENVAAYISGWQTALYAPRVLSDDGQRVFFNSFEALAAGDTNGVEDVYQWEAEGSGTCDASSQDFSLANDGCVSLISSGESPTASEFVDASPSGDDAFFATGAGLVSQDYGLVDIYDAKVGGGFPEPPPPPAGCEGEACQGPLAAPNDPTPASSSFEGAGNVVEGRSTPRCAKGKARRKGRCVAKKHQHKRDHAKRAGRQAR